MVIGKNRAGGDGWWVWHKAVNSGGTAFLKLNTTGALTSTQYIANNTAPSSSVVTLGSDAGWNSSSMVLYCFAPVEGYSAFGSYTGNGSSDGPFVYTGFRPRWLLIKRTDATSDWWIWDTARTPYNLADTVLYPNTSDADTTIPTVLGIDVLSNGFKMRMGNFNPNASSGTLIYAAFAESPQKYARAR